MPNLNGKLPPFGKVPARDVPGSSATRPVVDDLEVTPGETYHIVALAEIGRVLNSLARKIASSTKPVDEYSGTSFENVVFTETQPLEVQPNYDQFAERISAVIVTGPPNTTFTLILGDREWALVTSASGFMVMNGIGLLLGRTNRRVLYPGAAGQWTLELTGFADEQF